MGNLISQRYKKVKNGIIPEEWQIKEMGEVADFINGRAYKQEELLESGKYKILRVGNFFTNSDWYFSNLELPEEKYAYNEDLLYSWSGSFGPRIWNGNKIIFHYHIWKIVPKIQVDKKYIYYYLEQDTATLKNNIQGGTMLHITKNDMEKRKILFPNMQEQKAIAQILITWDTAIEKQEGLLKLKKEQKIGLTKNLLSGKKRIFLKNDDKKWERIKAKEIFENITDKNHNGKLEVLSSTQDRGVIPRKDLDIDIKYDKKSLGSYKKVSIGDFVISLRSFQGGIELSEYEGIISPAYTIFIVNQDGLDNYFFKHLFKSINFIKKLDSCIYGIRDGKTIKFSDFGEIKLDIPSYREQKAIAQILNTADKEIELLEKELEYLKEQKRGLMQNLLTGKVRVKIS